MLPLSFLLLRDRRHSAGFPLRGARLCTVNMGLWSSKEAVIDSGSTRHCSLFLQTGLKGTCQDSVLVVEDPFDDGTSVLAGVFDGHGTCGHHVSQAVRAMITERLKAAFTGASGELRGEQQQPALEAAWTRVLTSVFADVDDELRKDMFRNKDSGSTAVLALRQGSELIVAHIGDSRCVLARAHSTEAAVIEAVQLTRDHKASNLAEKERVTAAGGRVMNFMNTIDRIFLPGKCEPGLAVSRAFADFDLKGHGLTCEPEVFKHTLGPGDQFIVMASDGVWDVLKNKEVVEIVANAWPRRRAAKLVAQRAVAVWAKEKHGSRDDISVVVLFVR